MIFVPGQTSANLMQCATTTNARKNMKRPNTDAFGAIRNCPVPTIAAINGVCFGGGFGIAAACDLRFSTPDARFCIPAAKLGLAYPVEAMADIVHAVGAQRAKQLLFTAEIFNAQSAHQYGFLSAIFDGENFEAEIEKISQKICANAPLSNIASKQAIIAALSNDPEESCQGHRPWPINF